MAGRFTEGTPMTIRAKFVSLGTIAVAAAAILAVANPTFDHLGASASNEEKIQQQINSISGIIEQQAWMRDFNLCMRLHAEEAHNLDLCRQEADEKAAARRREGG